MFMWKKHSQSLTLTLNVKVMPKIKTFETKHATPKKLNRDFPDNETKHATPRLSSHCKRNSKKALGEF